MLTTAGSTTPTRILVLHSGRIEHFLAATRAVAARHPEASFVGIVRSADVAEAEATGLFEALHHFPTNLRASRSLPLGPLPFDACVLPFEDRLGVQYWTYRCVPIWHGIPLVYTFDRRGHLTARGRRAWIVNTLVVSFGIRPFHDTALHLWLWLRPHLEVCCLFSFAFLALVCRGLWAVGLYRVGRGAGGSGPASRRRLVLFIPSLGIGGAQRQLVSFLTHLDRERWEAELLTMERPDKFFEPAIHGLGVPIHYLNPKGDYWMAGAIWRLAGHLRSHPCHVLHSWLHYAAALGAIGGSLAGVPIIVGSLRSERPARFPWFYPRWQRAIDILTAPLQTYIIANSKAVKEENRRWALIPLRKLLTVYNGIDLKATELPDRDRLSRLRRELGLPKGAGVVGIVGRLYPEKDHATFLRAAGRVVGVRPETHFLIIGDGASRDAVQDEARRLGLDGRVHLLGSRKDVLPLIRLMDVHVLTSLSEGFPNVLLEAAVAGTPNVTTAAGGAAEVVEDAVSGYVVACGDDKALAGRILELLEDPLLRRRIADAARDRVRTRFAAHQVAAEIERSYELSGESRLKADDDRPVRLWFISPYAYAVLRPGSGLPVGGAEVQVGRLVRELAQDKRFAVTLLTGYGDQTGREQSCGWEFMVMPCLGRRSATGDIGPAGTTGKRPSGLLATLRRAAGRTTLRHLRERWDDLVHRLRWLRLLAKERPDIVVMRCATPHVGYVQRACAMLGIHLVYQVAHEQDINGEYARRQGLWGARFESGLQGADAVVCQHAGQLSLLWSRYGIQGRLLRSLAPMDGTEEADHSTRSIVLWIARLDPWKHPELFVELAQRMPDQRFVMVGPPSETEAPQLEGLGPRIERTPNLRWISGMPFEEAAELFKHALVFVNTSEAEGFPNTFLQAAACGTPIVSWSVNPDQILDEHQLGYCAGKDWKQFEHGVRLLCTDAGLRGRLGENGRRYVRDKHDAGRITEEYVQLFLALAGKAMRAPSMERDPVHAAGLSRVRD